MQDIWYLQAGGGTTTCCRVPGYGYPGTLLAGISNTNLVNGSQSNDKRLAWDVIISFSHDVILVYPGTMVL